MSADRYEFHINSSGRLEVSIGGTVVSVSTPESHTFRAIRQQARDIESLRAELAARDVSSHPGVQGLAQLGRNALVRVAELESAIAERDARIAELTAERDEARTAYQVRNTEWHQHELIALVLAERHKARAERAESELARMREQEPVAWQYRIGCEIWTECTRQGFDTLSQSGYPECETRQLYAEPMPAKEAK